ncbi:MAG TPA: hypothetical protein DEV93_02485 [Chloroflexi bacterium]|nr:hypothetical protein [Chloroflexota bacterium]
MGWITLPRNLLEMQLDSLGLERNRYETGVTDGDEVSNTERLNDYADWEEDARCPSSLEEVTAEEVLRHPPSGVVARCHTCGKTVTGSWRGKSQTWVKMTHLLA